MEANKIPNNPPQLVFPGQGTNDEMFFIPIEFIPYQEGDENIYLGNTDNCSLTGDINQDEDVNILDVVLLVNSILDGTDLSCSDLNEDNIINILDVVLLVGIILA